MCNQTEANYLDALNFNSNVDDNSGWLASETEKLVNLEKLLNDKQETYHNIHYEERRWCWKRNQVLNQELVPTFIAYAHGMLGSYSQPHQYQLMLKGLFNAKFQGLNTTGMRRVVFRRVQKMDPWFKTGGQSCPGPLDVEALPPTVFDNNNNTEDVIATTFDFQELINWAKSD
ncbi:unnamed protein product [Absidia cylindrospora]